MGLWGILTVVVAVCLVDRGTKSLALERLPRRAGPASVLRLSINRRLPLAADVSARRLAGFWILAVACASLAVVVSPALRSDPMATIGIAAALAGATSNLGEWIQRGRIVDFICIGWWPAFNLADAAIVTGGILAGTSLLH
jgi:signal peptidase II